MTNEPVLANCPFCRTPIVLEWTRTYDPEFIKDELSNKWIPRSVVRLHGSHECPQGLNPSEKGSTK